MLYSSSLHLVKPKSLEGSYVSLLNTAQLNLLNELMEFSVVLLKRKKREKEKKGFGEKLCTCVCV